MIRTLGAVLLLAACGTSAPTATCKGTVTGSGADQPKGTFSTCDTYDDLYLQNLDTFNFTASYTELPTSFTFQTSWAITGEPTAMAYTQDVRGVDCTIQVQKGKLTWVARKGEGAVAAGSCTLDLSAVKSLGFTGNTEGFKLTGQLRGHLEASPGTGSTGTVDVSMDFDG